MKVQFKWVGDETYPETFVHMDQVPRIGEIVELPGMPFRAKVRNVTWWPFGDAVQGNTPNARHQFVCVTVGKQLISYGPPIDNSKVGKNP